MTYIGCANWPPVSVQNPLTPGQYSTAAQQAGIQYPSAGCMEVFFLRRAGWAVRTGVAEDGVMRCSFTLRLLYAEGQV